MLSTIQKENLEFLNRRTKIALSLMWYCTYVEFIV